MIDSAAGNTFPSEKMTAWCLSIGAVVFALSTFFWTEGEYGVNGGALMAVSMVFWIPGFIALLGMVRTQMPRYSTWALLPAWYGCVGGSLFGFQGVYSAAFDITNQMERAAYASYPMGFNLTLFWPGPMFPLSLLALAVCLLWTRSVPAWSAILLGLAAIAFPASRIARIVWLAHVSDALLLVPTLYLAYHILKRSKPLLPTAIVK